MLLHVGSLTSGYGKVRIVSDVSLSVEEREIVAVIGRNGVGKTTLMKTLIGQIRAFAGTVEFRDQDVSRMRAAERAQLGMGYVPQGRGIFARLSVADNLRMGEQIGARGKAPDYARVHEYFPILKERHAQKAGSLSGGEQQQLAIGRVLVGHPELVLLDEPSEGIQPSIVQSIGEIIKRLRTEIGLTFVIVEQNLDLINAVADRCIVIDKGSIIARLDAGEMADPAIARKYLAI